MNISSGRYFKLGRYLEMRDILRRDGYEQIPQLTSSKMVDVQSEPFNFVPAQNAYGRKRAVLIGINYVGQQGELSGCHNVSPIPYFSTKFTYRIGLFIS